VKVLMLGWEFPPFISGGLGTACYGLTRAMGRLGIKVTFILPGFHQSVKVAGFENIRFRPIASALRPYASNPTYQKIRNSHLDIVALLRSIKNYNCDMRKEVYRYADQVAKIAATEDFDIIHAHDWMTFPAGIAASCVTGKPLVVQIHSTEFDRSGEHVNQMIYDIERQGMHAANKVITVSNYTRNTIIDRYAVPPEKVDVVYNGVESDPNLRFDVPNSAQHCPADRIVLFLGRITMQKGPEYFLAAAKKVLEIIPDSIGDHVKFVMAGDGDMLHRTIELAAELGIGGKVLFTGFLRGIDVDRIYRMADLYVMPSVSEPFGIAALEALQHNVPVLVSKQSGVAEVLSHVLKVDFWDINQMAEKIIAVLSHPPLARTLQQNGLLELHKLRWEDSAAKVCEIYKEMLAQKAGK